MNTGARGMHADRFIRQRALIAALVIASMCASSVTFAQVAILNTSEELSDMQTTTADSDAPEQDPRTVGWMNETLRPPAPVKKWSQKPWVKTTSIGLIVGGVVLGGTFTGIAIDKNLEVNQEIKNLQRITIGSNSICPNSQASTAMSAETVRSCADIKHLMTTRDRWLGFGIFGIVPIVVGTAGLIVRHVYQPKVKRKSPTHVTVLPTRSGVVVLGTF